MPIQHITELFALDEREFIIEAYRTLLQREPDEHGMAYYLGRLAQGYSKASVIVQLAQSQECQPHAQIEGLKILIAEERFASHWFFRFFNRQNRLEKIFRSNTSTLERIYRFLENRQAPEQRQEQFNRLLNNKSFRTEIDNDIVSDLYICLLGREPESESVISYYKGMDNWMEIIKTIISSEEFLVKISEINRVYNLNTAREEMKSDDERGLFRKINSNHGGVNSLQRTPLETHFKIYKDA